MQINDQAAKILDLSKEVYPYAYALTLDELYAYQLVVDTMTRFFSQSELHENISWEEFLPHMYELATKSDNFENSSIGSDYFSTLNLKNRSALFLKDKLNLKMSDISDIMNINISELISSLQFSREYLVSREA